MSVEERFAFLAEWYDPNAALLRRYQLLFYPKDGSVEMFDVKNQRIFLRRTKYDCLHLEDLFVGNRLNIFSRQLHLIDYGDQHTASKLGSKKQRTLAMIKPDAVAKMGTIIQLINDAGLTITKLLYKMNLNILCAFRTFVILHCNIFNNHFLGLTGNILNAILDAGFQITALQMFVHLTKNVSFCVFEQSMVEELCAGPCIALEICGPEAPKAFREFCGPADPEIARHLRPQTLRAIFGKNKLKNAVHCTDLPEDGILEVNIHSSLI
uniref:NME/NM23 family member 7 n=1 Tax=Erpetoichthys calabaricus TaxID=27687 RepID=A0A8C4S978_ERPCA